MNDDLSEQDKDILKNINSPKRELTAGELWINITHHAVIQALDKDAPGNAITSYKRRLVNALGQIFYWQITRTRMQVDEMITLLDASSQRCAELKEEHDATPWWRFARQRRLLRQHQDQLILQGAYQAAIKVIANTTPPKGPEA